MSNKLKPSLEYRELITFAIVGVLNTGVDFGVFSLVRFVMPAANEIYAQAAGYTMGVVCSYLLNKYITFKNTAKGLRQFALFILCNALTLCVSMIAIYYSHSVMGIQEHLAKLLLVTPVIMILNYLLYKFVVFRNPKSQRIN